MMMLLRRIRGPLLGFSYFDLYILYIFLYRSQLDGLILMDLYFVQPCYLDFDTVDDDLLSL